MSIETLDGSQLQRQQLHGELMMFAHMENPDPDEIGVLGKFGREYVVNSGGKGTLSAVAVHGPQIAGEPGVTIVESRDRVVVLERDESPTVEIYEAASMPGSRTVLFDVERGDVTALVSAHPEKFGARVLFDSTRDSEAFRVRREILTQLADQTMTVDRPGSAVERQFFTNVQPVRVNSFRDPSRLESSGLPFEPESQMHRQRLRELKYTGVATMRR